MQVATPEPASDSTSRSGLSAARAAVWALALASTAVFAWGVPTLWEREHISEPVRELARIARSAQVYYVKPRAAEGGQRALCQFPQGTIRSSNAPSCCDPSVTLGGGLCDPSKIEWNRTLWAALRWELKEPHAYVYEYKATGTLGEARYEVSAYGDLDCDGQYSTFRYVGKGDPRSNAEDCVLGASPEFEQISPDE